MHAQSKSLGLQECSHRCAQDGTVSPEEELQPRLVCVGKVWQTRLSGATGELGLEGGLCWVTKEGRAF